MIWRTGGTDPTILPIRHGGVGSSIPPFGFQTVSIPLAPPPLPSHTPTMSASRSTSTIRIQLLASYAERFGREYVELPVAEVRTAGEVMAALRKLPGGQALGAHTLIAVNLAQASPETAVAPGDEIAVLPPLAGG